jgi:hypothetical protein
VVVIQLDEEYKLLSFVTKSCAKWNYFDSASEVCECVAWEQTIYSAPRLKFGIASRCRRYEIQIFVGTLQSKKVVEHIPLNQRINYYKQHAY